MNIKTSAQRQLRWATVLEQCEPKSAPLRGGRAGTPSNTMSPRPLQVVGHLSGLRCARRIRFRANLVRSVHRRPADGDRKLRIITTQFMYADDTQVYGSCRPSAMTTFTTKISECVEATTSWMRSNRLQPNPEKTYLYLRN